MKTIKAWAIVDDEWIIPPTFIDTDKGFHIYHTKKEAQNHKIKGDKIVRIEIKILK